MDFLEQVSLKEYSWWKIGGPADLFCLPQSIEEVQQAVRYAHEKNLPITVLGGGTNVLISDKGIAGLVICLRKLVGVNVSEDAESVRVDALAGSPKSELTKIFLRKKMAPALFLCGLPGDVGGGVVMNAGVGENIKPREFVEIVEWVECVKIPDGTVQRFQKDELQWHYRHSKGWEPGIIVRAGLAWPNEPDDTIPRKVTEATKNRRGRQPLEWPSCGSTFKNPEGHKAGALIEKAGLKGYRVGGAEISTKHANFIINLGHATAADVDRIIHHVQEEVSKRFGVNLETEVRYLGRW